MPDDIAAHMRARGAEQVTIRARMAEGERLQRHAAWRLPMDHEDAPLIDRLHAAGELDHRQYANACACAALYDASGQGGSRGVASYLREERGASPGEEAGPEDEWRTLLRDCQARDPVGLEYLLAILKSEPWASAGISARRAGRLLDTLDGLQAKWQAERWAEEA